jgi:hypothetical protein
MPGNIELGIELRCQGCGKSKLEDKEFPAQGLHAISKLAHLQKIGVPLGWKFEQSNGEAWAMCPLCQSTEYNSKHKCPKCRYGAVKTTYCGGSQRMACELGVGGEHLHRICQRCNYIWVEKCLSA